jgi:hypothetical protein
LLELATKVAPGRTRHLERMTPFLAGRGRRVASVWGFTKSRTPPGLAIVRGPEAEANMLR